MFFCIIKIWANVLILVIYLESFISCNDLYDINLDDKRKL